MKLRQAAVGVAIGLVAQMLLPGHYAGAMVVGAALSLAGALAAGFAGERLNLYEAAQPAALFMSALGALAMLLLYGVAVHSR